MNVWTFTGNLGRDASTRFIADGNAVTDFSVAVSAGWGDKKTTTWVRCSYWGKRGEAVAPYLLKGSPICVSGEARLHEFEKRDKSGTGYSMELRVSELTLMGNKEKKPAPVAAQEDLGGGFREQPVTDDFEDTKIPF
jgi:single-strand DNA-binding protein